MNQSIGPSSECCTIARARAMLSNILPYVEAVWTYDGETKEWSSYSPGAPSDLTEMVDGKGYWLKINEDVTWTFERARVGGI